VTTADLQILPVLLSSREGFLSSGERVTLWHEAQQVSEQERLQRCWKFCPDLSSPFCCHCDKQKWKNKVSKNGLNCVDTLNSVPEADIHVMGGEIMSFTKRLLQIVTFSWVSVAPRVLSMLQLMILMLSLRLV